MQNNIWGFRITMAKESKIYVRTLDKKEHTLVAITNHRNMSKKGKRHIAKVFVNDEFINVFASSAGYYAITVDDDIVFDKLAIMYLEKGNGRAYFAMTEEDFLASYKQK